MTIEVDLGDIRLDAIGEMLLRTQTAAFVQGYSVGQSSENYIDCAANLLARCNCQYPQHQQGSHNPFGAGFEDSDDSCF